MTGVWYILKVRSSKMKKGFLLHNLETRENSEPRFCLCSKHSVCVIHEHRGWICYSKQQKRYSISTLYPSRCPLTVSFSTAAQVTLMVVLFISTTPTSMGASNGTERQWQAGWVRCAKEYWAKYPQKKKKRRCCYFTIFPWVANDGVWLRSVPFIIDSLNFDLKGREVADVTDNERRCRRIVGVPVRPAAHHSPPQHPVPEVGSIEVTFVHFLQRSKEHPIRHKSFL